MSGDITVNNANNICAGGVIGFIGNNKKENKIYNNYLYGDIYINDATKTDLYLGGVAGGSNGSNNSIYLNYTLVSLKNKTFAENHNVGCNMWK